MTQASQVVFFSQSWDPIVVLIMIETGKSGASCADACVFVTYVTKFGEHFVAAQALRNKKCGNSERTRGLKL